VSGYSNEDQLEVRKEKAAGANWYVKLRGEAMLYFLLMITFIEVFGIIQFKSSPFLDKIQPLLILFLCITLLTMNLGSIGRFKNIFYLLSLSRYVILIGLQPLNYVLKVYSYLLIPILVLWVLVIFRAGFYFMDPFLLLNNGITAFFVRSNESLSEFLIGH
jgi:hypothetical protein